MTILIEQDNGIFKRFQNVLKYVIYDAGVDYTIVTMDISVSRDWCYTQQLKIKKNAKIILIKGDL